MFDNIVAFALIGIGVIAFFHWTFSPGSLIGSIILGVRITSALLLSASPLIYFSDRAVNGDIAIGAALSSVIALVLTMLLSENRPRLFGRR